MTNLAGWLKFQELSTNKYSSDVVLTTFAIQVDQDKNPKPVEKLILRILKANSDKYKKQNGNIIFSTWGSV